MQLNSCVVATSKASLLIYITLVLVKEKHLLVYENKGRCRVGLLVTGKKRTEARDDLTMPVHYVTQRKNSLKTNATNV